MSTTVRYDMSAMKLIASAKQTINSATTTAFDFGTPNDINLASAASATAGYTPGDRVLVIVSASTAGTTHTLAVVVQDADDNAGNIGTPATAVTSAVNGSLDAAIGDRYTAVAVKIKPNRPWLRVAVTDVGNDSYVCHCMVFAVPSGL